MGGFLGDVFDYQKHLMGDVWDKYRTDPERAVLGINTPFESKLWGGVTGKEYAPTTDMFGGNTEKQSQDFEKQGVNTGPGERMHDLARAVTAAYAGSYGLSQLPAMGAGGMGGIPGPGGQRPQQLDDPMQAMAPPQPNADPAMLQDQEMQKQQMMIAALSKMHA